MNPTAHAPRPPAPDRPHAIWTPATFRARALELMETHHAGWWSCQRVAFELAPSMRLAWVEVAVPSATVASALYRVRYDVASDSATCACIAAQRGQPCFHAGVAIAYGREARRQPRIAAQTWQGHSAGQAAIVLGQAFRGES